ncbi:DUF1289 domain-containing protein [Crenobacter cavernae]|uniref:DUF1289 domain-containing protein n=1 Tax=Crenobacter cavernae TaxID=2290923 RepID=A0A345Y8Y9_9NEIS|nr:cysteine-rich CWC family protein [Crenobacter cavernae]AXK40391.1 DUF1289 domain-containing protein [Crenobacter cavernae]
MSDIPSPCVKLCQLDDARAFCTGCRRTLDEIAQWSKYSAAQKRAVWARLESESPTPVGRAKRCERCDAEFACGSGGRDGRCWCNELPQVLPLAADGGDCLCPNCLADHLRREYEKRDLTPPF